MCDLVEEIEKIEAKIALQDKQILDLQRESNEYRKLLNSAATCLDDAENRISELLFLLKKAKGYLPYDKNDFYQQINETVIFSSVEENLPILRNQIDSTLEAFEIEGISIGTWEEESITLPIKKREDHLRYFAESMAEYDCSYGDDCPDFAGTRHGTCHACKARKVLKECEKLVKY